MKKIKEVLLFVLSAMISVSMVFNTLVVGAESVLYNESYMQDNVEHYFIIGLEKQPLSCYDKAKEIGVRDFVLTEEGKSAYDEISVLHLLAKKDISDIIGRKPTVKYDYTAAFNGFSMALSLNEVNKISEHAEEIGIVSIEYGSSISPIATKSSVEKESTIDEDISYSDFTNKIFEQTGITESGLDGEGTVIAVIDNEFDCNHEFLTAPSDFTGKYSQLDINSVYQYLSAGPYISSKCYLNEKIPYRFSYDKMSFNTNDYTNAHGTHVAGIVSGNCEAETCTQYDPKGTAPNTQLLLLSTASLNSDECLAAYDDVLYLGADVVNASYGVTGATERSLYSETQAIQNIVNTGTIFCAAAGNNDKCTIFDKNFTDYSTGGKPDSIGGVMTVGSADNIVFKEDGNKILLSDGSEEAIVDGELNGLVESFVDESFEYVVISGFGEEEDFEGLDLTNKIALVKRGEITFDKKMINAMDVNAAGVLIYNNDSSNIFSISSDLIPVGMVSKQTGEKLSKLDDKTITFSKGIATIELDKTINVSDFSTWGFTEQLLLKPDISGFGGNIVSSIADEYYSHERYAIYSGTSMATPQLTGINALMKQYIDSNSDKYNIVNRSEYPEFIAKLLMSTATPIYTSDDLETASPRVQGNGLVNISNAISTPCYISSDSEKDNFRPKISLGDGYKQSYTLDFNVTNISENDCTYTLSTDLFKDEADENGNLALNTLRLIEDNEYIVTYTDENGNKLDNVTIEAGKTKKVSAVIKMSETVYNKIKSDGGRFVDGFVRLTSESNPNLTLSFMAYCGNWADVKSGDVIFDFGYKNPESDYMSFMSDESLNTAGVNMIDMSIGQPVYSPSGDNVFDNITLDLYFKRRCYDITARILNSDGEEIYSEYLVDSANRILFGDILMSETISINWDFKENGVIKNNAEYTIELSAVMPLSEESVVIGSQSFKVDTEKPEIKNAHVINVYGTDYIVIEAEDNVALQGAVNSQNMNIFSLASINSSSSGENLVLDISGNKLSDKIQVYDMAGNFTEISISDAESDISVVSDDTFGYAVTDEEDFYSDKMYITDENGNIVDVDISGDVTPSEAYEINGNGEVDVMLLIDGFETITFTMNVGIRGDANNDGICNIRDAAYIAKFLSNKTDEEYDGFLESIAGYCSDFNDDDYVSVRDAAAIAKNLAENN